MAPRILHIGVGNFHRAHQADYTARATGEWRVTGVVMGNIALYDAMKNGEGFPLVVRGPNGADQRQVSIHDRMILARENPQAVVDAFIDPDLHVVTLTITEKGYCLDPATGTLDVTNPAIASDLSKPPSSAIGFLVHGLAERKAAGLPPLTVISCDNLSENGHKLERAVYDFVQATSLTVDGNTCFPNTMVDRITPATSNATDPVITEDFTEWVIEHKFAGQVPAWDAVGAEFTDNVAPFEMRKLRLLNASHSWLAYAGQLAGHTYVHEAIADPNLRRTVEQLWNEAQTTLPAVVQPTTAAYRDALIDRFAVKDMRHELAQIGADGSLKLRERIVPIITAGNAPQASEAVAAWIAFCIKNIRSSLSFVDPNADQIKDVIVGSKNRHEICVRLADLIGVSDAPSSWLDTLVTQVESYLARDR